MPRRIPKDLDKYLPSLVAGYRLIDLALSYILGRRKARIKWQLKVWMWYEAKDLEKSAMLAVPTMGTFSSGEMDWKKWDAEEGKKLGLSR